MSGVMGVMDSVTRMDAREPEARLEQVWSVHAPVGADEASQRMKSCAVVIGPNGVSIRFAAVRASARRAATVAGQTGPPGWLQLGSLEPTQ